LGFAHSIGGTRHVFADLRTLLARATPPRSGDALAGVAAGSAADAQIGAGNARAARALRRHRLAK
jgi:ethanolamine ammonia-lyase large subunit